VPSVGCASRVLGVRVGLALAGVGVSFSWGASVDFCRFVFFAHKTRCFGRLSSIFVSQRIRGVRREASEFAGIGPQVNLISADTVLNSPQSA